MQTNARLLSVLIFAAIAVAADDAPKKQGDNTRPYAVLKSYGLFAANIVGRVTEDTIFRDVDKIVGVRLIEQTNQVPCVVGERFGVVFDIRDLPTSGGQESLRVVWRYPKLKSPSGKVSRSHETSWPIKIGNGAATDIYLDWGLEDSFELASGRWIIEVYYRNVKLLKQEFIVVGCDQRR